MKFTVKAWDAMNVATRYEGRDVLRALLELVAARRLGFRRVVLEVTR